MQAPPVGISSVSVGPIEDRFAGLGTGKVLLVGCHGCTLRCAFCQNHDVSHVLPVDPDESAASWIANEASGLRGVLFTHSEPIVARKLVRDVSLLVRPSLVAAKTSAHCDEATFRSFMESVDAINVDVKGGADDYRELCDGNFDLVVRNVALAKSMGKHVELTFLIIPGRRGLRKVAREMALVAGDSTVWIVGFVPANLMRDWPMARKSHLESAFSQIRDHFKEVKTPY